MYSHDCAIVSVQKRFLLAFVLVLVHLKMFNTNVALWPTGVVKFDVLNVLQGASKVAVTHKEGSSV